MPLFECKKLAHITCLPIDSSFITGLLSNSCIGLALERFYLLPAIMNFHLSLKQRLYVSETTVVSWFNPEMENHSPGHMIVGIQSIALIRELNSEIQYYYLTLQPRHGVQRRMISMDNFFVFLRFLFFALLLLYVT